MEGLLARFLENPSGKLKVWADPVEGEQYVIGADVAEGKVRDLGLMKSKPGFGNERPDYSAAIVIESSTTRHMASWHGYQEPMEYAFSLAAMGLHFNTALLVPELNGPGIAVVETLVRVISYPDVYRAKLFNRIEADGLGSEYGWRTTESSRKLLIAAVQRGIMLRTLKTLDQQLVKEMRTMVRDEQGRERARGKDKDDRVMALGLALQGRDEMVATGSSFRLPPEESRLAPEDRAMWRIMKDHLNEKVKSGSSARGRFGGYQR